MIDLPTVYKKRYKTDLDFEKFGFLSLEHLTANLSVVKKGNGDQTKIRAKQEVVRQWEDEERQGMAQKNIFFE